MPTSASHGVGQYYLLDVGSEKYGDCILCVFPNGDTVLIDGGHTSDFAGQSGYDSIPDQLKELLGDPPHKISLLVVTHCHGDHIGALPKIIDAELLNVEWALVSDEKIGFGRLESDAASDLDKASPKVRRVVAGLREEKHSDLTGPALDAFLNDAVTLESRYKAMLAELHRAGTKIVRYGSDDTSDFAKRFAPIGLQIIGPTPEQLQICSRAIASFNKDAVSSVKEATSGDATIDTGEIYRRLAAPGALDRPGKGAAINSTSIVLKLGTGSARVLFAGDMQFAQPEIHGLDQLMQDLMTAVNAQGPYALIKLSHHTSYNGLNETILDGWSDTKYLCHSGGSNDPGHPDANTLELLSGHASQISYARTDRNGRIKFTPGKGFELARGRVNDFGANKGKAGAEEDRAVQPLRRAAAEAAASPTVFRSSARIPWGDRDVELTFEISGGDAPLAAARETRSSPARATKQKQDDEEEGEASEPPPPPEQLSSLMGRKLGGGRSLPKLLFVTNRDQLVLNVGAQEATAALNMIKAAGQDVLEGSISDLPTLVRGALANNLAYQGVVLVGGYDVVRPQKLDVLDHALRTQLGPEKVADDPDHFVVWSDAFYGDRDGDGLPEVPVSRVPDARSSTLLLTALSADGDPAQRRFGMRNRERPFAAQIWEQVPGTGDLLVSVPALASNVHKQDVTAHSAYFMLHGSDSDGTRFWGENDDGIVEALNIKSVPNSMVGTVFAGCCWGALISNDTAFQNAHDAIPPRTVEASIALSVLAAGARAFVGCTGVHYSPDEAAKFFGGPMHDAFWAHVRRGDSPALALHEARIDYIRGMPHGRTAQRELAIERKILGEFTCIGLGW